MSASATLVRPRFLTGPSFTESAGQEVAELCELADFTPDPEQRLVLDGIFAFDRGLSAAFESAVIAPRQNLKTGVLKQAALGWLFVTRERLVVWSAHEFRTAQEAFRDLDQLIGGCPWLAREVKQIYTGKGQESIELRTGQRLIFKARTKSGGRGLTGDKVILDEAFALQPDHVGALLPTLSAVRDPQVVYGSSAGMLSSEILRQIRDRGRAGASPRMFYAEWCSPPGRCADPHCSHDLGSVGCQLDDPECQAEANPLLGRTRSNGTGLTLERLAALRQALPPGEFAREHMGWWDDPDERQLTALLWSKLADPGSQAKDPVAFAVDIALDRSWSAIGVGGRREDERKHGVCVDYRPGTEWLIGRILELNEKWRPCAWALDPGGPAGSLIKALDERGLKTRCGCHGEQGVMLISGREKAQACGGLFDDCVNDRFRHLDQPHLNLAVRRAVTKPADDAWVWSRKESPVDISPLWAVTLARFAFETHGMPEVPKKPWAFRA